MRTVLVVKERYEETVRSYVRDGWTVAVQHDGATVLWAPTRPYRPRPPGRALWLTLVTFGLYPFAVMTYWVLVAWWWKPLQVRRRQSVTVQVAT